MKREKGFTLIETIATIALGILVMTLITSVANLELKNLREVKNNEILHSNAIFIFDNLDYLIKRAQSATTSAEKLEITLLDSSTTIITADANKNITIDGIPLNSSSTEVKNLNFSNVDKSIRVGLTLQIKNASSSFSATTTIAQRSIK